MSSYKPFSTIVHPYPPKESPNRNACAYETGLPSARNAFVFIGGLGDGPHTVPYARQIARELEKHSSLSYSVFEVKTRSSFSGYRFSCLANDVADISELVRYLRGIGKEKIVLMGHSTGCQDLMEYAATSSDPVDGFILQAPVSDREGSLVGKGAEGEKRLDAIVSIAKDMISSGKGDHPMSHDDLTEDYDRPMSARRFYALHAKDGDDNYFGSNLSKEAASSLWKKIDKPLLILHAALDRYIDPSVDKKAQIDDWKALCNPGVASDFSGVIPGAGHSVRQPEGEEWLVNTVVRFLTSTTANPSSSL
ncbi:hypothetical protein PG999_006896 [Apiospora kogelbergensis]|uniref:Pimeloyl-ACP methyl ester carboxylesterase n=1 Tax=Apiospora kogelbergensis TaxID=1337665 RepID=A0AAW0QWS0_9PEZI